MYVPGVSLTFPQTAEKIDIPVPGLEKYSGVDIFIALMANCMIKCYYFKFLDPRNSLIVRISYSGLRRDVLGSKFLQSQPQNSSDRHTPAIYRHVLQFCGSVSLKYMAPN